MEVLSLNRFCYNDDSNRSIQYSFLKLGQGKSISEYASNLAGLILQEVPDLPMESKSWVIVYPGTGSYSIPNAITHVANIVGKKLNLDCIGLGKKDIATDDYAGRSKSERMKSRCISLAPEDRQRIKDKNFILVDDGIASGTAIEKSTDLLRKYGNLAACIVLADFRSAKDPSFERSLNRKVIRTGGMEVYPALLNNSQNYITSKLICYFSEDKSLLIEAFDGFEPLSLANLVLGTLVYHKRSAAKHLSDIRSNIIDRHSQRDDDMLKNLVALIDMCISKEHNMDIAIQRTYMAFSRSSRFRLDETQLDRVFHDLLQADAGSRKSPY